MADEQIVVIYDKAGEPHDVPKSKINEAAMAKQGFTFEPPESSQPVYKTGTPDYQASGSIEPMGQQPANNDQVVQQMQQQFAPTLSESIAKRPDLQKTIDALKPVAQGVSNFAAGAGLSAADAILGNVASVGNLAPDTINLIAGTNIPRMQGTNFKQYTPEGLAGQAGNFTGDVLGNIVGGGAAFKALGSVPKLSNEASVLANTARGAIAGFGTGAENPGGRFAGGAEGALLGPLSKMTNKGQADIIARQSDAIKKSASKKYSDIFKRAGNDLALPSSSENLNYDIIKRAFTKDQRINVDKYFENPTLENAHKAQSDLGYKIRKLVKRDDALDYEKIDYLKQAREAIKNGMSKTIEQRIPGGAEELNKIATDYATEYAPYLELKNLGKYKKGKATPKELLSGINTEFRTSNPGKSNSMLRSREAIYKALGSKPAKWALDASKIAVGTSPFAYGEYKGYRNSNDQ